MTPWIFVLILHKVNNMSTKSKQMVPKVENVLTVTKQFVRGRRGLQQFPYSGKLKPAVHVIWKKFSGFNMASSGAPACLLVCPYLCL